MINEKCLPKILKMLNARLEQHTDSQHVGIVICGGAALIALQLHTRTTNDVDVVALMDNNGHLASPAPLPTFLVQAANEVANLMSLPKDWLNNGPSSNDGGLFQMGLPYGCEERLHIYPVGPLLTTYFIDRLDQIHFKLYASVDRGGYHINDLVAMNPSDAELHQAACWTFTHDVSPAFQQLVKDLLLKLGYTNVVERL